MNKNYYEILQVNKNASNEIIEKAYKTLVKKYHPDLQQESTKAISEEKLKLINEAYDILSDSEKRKQYDISLEKESISQEEFNKIYKENQVLKNELNNIKNKNIDYNKTNYNENKNSYNYQNDYVINQYKSYEQEFDKARKQAYHDAYIQDLKNRGYKIRSKKTYKDYLKSFIALILTIFILFLLWQLPFVRNPLIKIYNENIVVKTFVDIIMNLFNNVF